MRIALATIVVLVTLLGGCRDRERVLFDDPWWALVRALNDDRCMGTGELWDAYDALALAALERAPDTTPEGLKAQLASVPVRRASSLLARVSVRGDPTAIVIAVGLECDAFREAGGRVSWFARAPDGWRRIAFATTQDLAWPEILWIDPGKGRAVIAERAMATQDEIVNVRALVLQGGRLEEVAAATGLHTSGFEPSTSRDGVRFRHWVPLERFSASSAVSKAYDEVWSYVGPNVEIQRVSATPWLELLDRRCADDGGQVDLPDAADLVGCQGRMLSASSTGDHGVEVVVADVPFPERYGCPRTSAITLTLRLEESGGTWEVVHRRLDGASCVRDAGT